VQHLLELSKFLAFQHFMNHRISLLAALCLTLAPLSAFASGTALLADFLAKTQSAKSEFTQTTTAPSKNGDAPRVTSASGQFAFSRPSKFSFSYAKPFSQLIVSDGDKLWMHDLDLNQVTQRNLSLVRGQVPALVIASAANLKTLERNYTFTDQGERDGLQWVYVQPKRSAAGDDSTESLVQSIELGLRAGAVPVLAELRFADSFGQRTVMKFAKSEVNPKLAADAFKFVMPAGATKAQ
jgi:outer membrane lipoprotein carrier protein